MDRKKQKKSKAPPLSTGDKVLYYVMMWGWLIGPWILMLAAVEITRTITFASDRVIAFRMSILYMLLYWGVGVALSALFGWMREKRYPVFGNREVRYGSPQYNEVYPLLGRHEVSRRPGEEWKKTAAALKCLWLLSFAVLLSGLLLIAPAYVLTGEDSVEVYDRLGRTEEVYTAEQINAVVLYGNVKGRTKTVRMSLEMADGEAFSFNCSDFNNTDSVNSGINMALSSMQRIKGYVDPTAVTITGVDNLPKIADKLNLSPAEEAQLYALFEAELP